MTNTIFKNPTITNLHKKIRTFFKYKSVISYLVWYRIHFIYPEMLAKNIQLFSEKDSTECFITCQNRRER